MNSPACDKGERGEIDTELIFLTYHTSKDIYLNID